MLEVNRVIALHVRAAVEAFVFANRMHPKCEGPDLMRPMLRSIPTQRFLLFLIELAGWPGARPRRRFVRAVARICSPVTPPYSEPTTESLCRRGESRRHIEAAERL